MQTFEERAAYVKGLIEAVGAEANDHLVRRLVQTWVFAGFSRMVEEVRAMRRLIAAAILAGLLAGPAWAQEPTPGASPSSEPRSKVADIRSSGLNDPSENVKAVLEAGMKALADIIGKEVKRTDDLRASVEKIAQTETKRLDEIIALNAKHETKMADVVREFNKEKSEAESKRIDALRTSDAAATKEAQQLALSSIKDITAQAFAAAKDATAKQENAADKRFEQQRSELAVQFKSQDEKLALLTNQNNISSGRDAGAATIWGVAGVVLGLLLGVAGLAFNLTRSPPPAPVVNYHPPPQNGSTYNYAPPQSTSPPH